jgi:hypothetical protein
VALAPKLSMLTKAACAVGAGISAAVSAVARRTRDTSRGSILPTT